MGFEDFFAKAGEALAKEAPYAVVVIAVMVVFIILFQFVVKELKSTYEESLAQIRKNSQEVSKERKRIIDEQNVLINEQNKIIKSFEKKQVG